MRNMRCWRRNNALGGPRCLIISKKIRYGGVGAKLVVIVMNLAVA
jgi:hypothetical protein